MGLLTERQARKVIGEIFQISNRHALVSETIGDYFTRWLASKKEPNRTQEFPPLFQSN